MRRVGGAFGRMKWMICEAGRDEERQTREGHYSDGEVVEKTAALVE